MKGVQFTDVIIVGAGLSGIGAACHLARKSPGKTYQILESRSEIGGTWSLFKYPGIRSDSDMYTFGYSFKTWDNPKSFADAPSILAYLEEVAEEYEVHEKIRYYARVKSAHFDTDSNVWSVTIEDTRSLEEVTCQCRVLFSCTGYYNYENGYTPDFEGIEDFRGDVVHPQHWPEHLDYRQKKVVVIGSGATAVTIIPEMAEHTAAITMLQRSPSYVGAFPNEDKVAGFLKRILPKRVAHQAIRFKNILVQMLFFQACRIWPEKMKELLIKGAQERLGDFPAKPHFEPHYKPWDQRFCIAPDGDLFASIKEGKATVVTDHIERITPEGIKLKSGGELPADIIVTATGLQLLAFGGAEVTIGDKPFDAAKSLTYKGLMLSGLPNSIFFAGYTNASWTLKSDLTSEYASRLLRYMDRKGHTSFMPQGADSQMETMPLLNLNSGYIHRSAHEFPRQGSKMPWRLYQNYFLDFIVLRMSSIKDKYLKFE